MKVLVLGGSGFLSGAMTREAIDAGHQVDILTRGKRPTPAGARVIAADRNDLAAFSGAIARANTRWDLVIDCIGFNAGHAKQDLAVFAPLAGHLIFISTDFVFDPVDRPWQIDETYSRFDSQSDYGRGKRAAEVVLLGDEGRASGLPITVLRPCHIYGPGSQLGCLPLHGRDVDLIARLRRGEPLKLVGGGHFLQQPVFVPDLAKMALSCFGNPNVVGHLYHSPGPEVVASWEFYKIIADVLGVGLTVQEVPIAKHLKTEPGHRSFCCHRVYNRDKAISHGLATATTPLRQGLKVHVESMLT